MLSNKDIRVENGNLVLNGDKYPLDGQSPEAIMEIVEDNSDTTPTENSTAPVTSGGVYTALGTKQDTLTFDTTPTDESTNPVTSGGVFTALGTKQDALTVTDISSQATVDDTYVSEFKAYTYGKLIYLILALKPGVSDQTPVVSGLPNMRGLTGVKGVMPMFYMNAADAGSNGVCGISSGRIEYRGTTTSGTNGTVYSGMFILE